jgi:hypothetical protein
MEESPRGQDKENPASNPDAGGTSKFRIPQQGGARSQRKSQPPRHPSGDADEAAWKQFFDRYGQRIDDEAADRKEQLVGLRRRGSVVFYLYATMAGLAITSGAVAVALAVLYSVKHGFAVPSIASGGVFFVTTSGSLVLMAMRRQLGSEERELSVRLNKLQAIEASMYAARVATDTQARCEMLAEMSRAWNALDAKQTSPRVPWKKKKSSEHGHEITTPQSEQSSRSSDTEHRQ